MVSAKHLNRYQMDDKWIHEFSGYALVYVFLCKLTSISLWPGSSAQDSWMLASLNVFASLWILSLSHSTNMQKKENKNWATSRPSWTHAWSIIHMGTVKGLNFSFHAIVNSFQVMYWQESKLILKHWKLWLWLF